jgi:hypothetical protein
MTRAGGWMMIGVDEDYISGVKSRDWRKKSVTAYFKNCIPVGNNVIFSGQYYQI